MPKKSIIKKRISRKIQTQTYENLEIHCEFEEEVEWDTIAERREKSQKISNLLMLDFKQTMKTALEELELHRKNATVTTKKQD